MKVSNEVWERRIIKELGKVDDTESVITVVKVPSELVGSASVAVACPLCKWVGLGEVLKYAVYPGYTGADIGGATIGVMIESRPPESKEFKDKDICPASAEGHRQAIEDLARRCHEITFAWHYKQWLTKTHSGYAPPSWSGRPTHDMCKFSNDEGRRDSYSEDCPGCLEYTAMEDGEAEIGRVEFSIDSVGGEPQCAGMLPGCDDYVIIYEAHARTR
jgi:hypothetical protein